MFHKLRSQNRFGYKHLNHGRVTSPAVRGLIVWVAMLLVCSPRATCQSIASADFPKATIERLFKAALNGKMLTPEGWSSIGALFANPTKLPPDHTVLVISSDYSTAAWSVSQDHATVYAGFVALGTIDDKLRYTPSDTKVTKWATIYHLTMVKGGNPDWKIENPEGSAWTGIRGAVSYVERKRNLTKDPNVVKNADTTLATLRSLRD
jgi:hypothetical protein